LTNTAGLETFLSTLNYAIYIAAFVESRTPSSTISQLFSKFAGRHTGASENQSSGPAPRKRLSSKALPFKALGSLLSETRTTLRLTSLLPLYVWLRAIIVNKDRQDRYLRAISLAQCISYVIFQFCENIAFLVDHGVISRRSLKRGGGSAKWWLISNRAWLAGVSCDFFRLARQAFLERDRRKEARRTKGEATAAEIEDQQAAERNWWSELFVASCWFPLCLHYSFQNGLKGVNGGVVGLLGFSAGLQSFLEQWASTADK
jgi:Peroxisomal biogenesis factor 11 (PEX11)